MSPTIWGHYSAAEKYFREALDIKRSWFDMDNPRTAEVATYVAQSVALSNLASVYRDKKPYARGRGVANFLLAMEF